MMPFTGGYTNVPLVIDYLQLNMGSFKTKNDKWLQREIRIHSKENLSDNMHIIGDALIGKLETLNDDDYSFVLNLLPELKLY